MNHPLTAVRTNKFRIRHENRLELRLDRPGDQPTRASAKDFGEGRMYFSTCSEKALSFIRPRD